MYFFPSDELVVEQMLLPPGKDCRPAKDSWVGEISEPRLSEAAAAGLEDRPRTRVRSSAGPVPRLHRALGQGDGWR